MLFNHEFAMDLIRARIVYAGAGLVGGTRTSSIGEDIAVLPGGYIVRFTPVGPGVVARIAHPAGNAFSPSCAIDDAVSFATFMAAVDGCILRTFKGPAAAVMDIADETAWLIRHHALPVSLPRHVDMHDGIGEWIPRPEALSLIGAMEIEMGRRPVHAETFLYGRQAGAPEPLKRTLVMWLERVDAWLMSARGGIPYSVYGEGYRWTRIETVAGLVAATRRIRRNEGFIGIGGACPDASEIADVERGLRRRQMIRGHFLDDSMPVYALRKDGSEATLLACVAPRSEKLVVMGSISAEWAGEASALLGESLGMGGHTLRS